MENNTPRAHFLEKHGAQTTLQAQLNRVQNGVNPTTQVVERYTGGRNRGRIKRPSAATRFLSHRDQLNIINRAKQILKNTGKREIAENKITFTNPIGEGYERRTLQYGKQYSGQVFFNQNDQPITAFQTWRG